MPLDVYVEAPDNVGGFVRHHEIPELIRVASPVYVKFGLRNAPDVYPAGTHLEATTVALSRERVRRARLGLELLARSGYEPTTSELGAAGLAVPVSPRHEGELMARPVTLFTGQWADLPLEDLAAKLRRLGLRRPRARLLGRPLRGRQGARRQRLRARRAASCSSGTISACGRSAPTSSARPSATGSTSATARSCRPRSTATASRKAFATRAAERMKDTARAAAQLGVTQVNGFTGSSIWHLIYSFPPNDFADDRARLRGVRRALEPDPRRVRRRGRAVRARGAPDRDRLRLRHDAQDAGRDRQPRGVRDQPRPEPLRATSSSTRRSSRSSSPIASTTCTSRTRASGSTGAARSSARTSTSARRRAAGTSSRPATATSTSRSFFRALNRIGYQGPLSIEWEDSGMDRDWGAPDALAFVRRTDFAPSEIAVRRGDAEAAKAPDAGRDRRRHARLRVHGQGARQRLPHAGVHDVAAAAHAATRNGRRSLEASRFATGRKTALSWEINS